MNLIHVDQVQASLDRPDLGARFTSLFGGVLARRDDYRGVGDLRGGCQLRIAAHDEEGEDRDGGHYDPRCGPPLTGCDTSDQLPATHGDKVTEGASRWLGS